MSTSKDYLKNFRISKKLGQVFLRDKNILRNIVEAGKLNKNDVVLEIGAGFGNLTEKLVEKVKKVFAVEKDRRLCQFLREKFKKRKGVKIIEGDIRDCLETLSKNLKDYKILGNIPYYLTSNLLERIFKLKNQPKLIVFMVQKEVAKRIVASPPEMNRLAILVQFFARAEIFHYVSKNCFFPKPKVDSAILRIFPKKPLFENEEVFFKVVKAGFSHPRKKILKNLSKGLCLEKEVVKRVLKICKIKEEERAERLSLKDWINLTNEFLKLK